MRRVNLLKYKDLINRYLKRISNLFQEINRYIHLSILNFMDCLAILITGVSKVGLRPAFLQA